MFSGVSKEISSMKWVNFDEIIDGEAKSNNKETKTIPTNFNEKYNL